VGLDTTAGEVSGVLMSTLDVPSWALATVATEKIAIKKTFFIF
jgi:hypothetical protein